MHISRWYKAQVIIITPSGNVHIHVAWFCSEARVQPHQNFDLNIHQNSSPFQFLFCIFCAPFQSWLKKGMQVSRQTFSVSQTVSTPSPVGARSACDVIFYFGKSGGS